MLATAGDFYVLLKLIKKHFIALSVIICSYALLKLIERKNLTSCNIHHTLLIARDEDFWFEMHNSWQISLNHEVVDDDVIDGYFFHVVGISRSSTIKDGNDKYTNMHKNYHIYCILHPGLRINSNLMNIKT